MKILLTGGGSGGHFYPVIAVAQALNELSKEKKLIDTQLYYAGPQPYDERLLYENKLTFVKIPSGKIRRYFSLLNIVDIFKTIFGIFVAFWKIFVIYPDVIFSKGGYTSFPVLCAGRFFRIPIVIHESDSIPGKTNAWAGKFARSVAVSYPEAAQYFPQEKVAVTGNPVRQDVSMPLTQDSYEFFGFDSAIPTILILGGSQGAQFINEVVLDALPKLVEKYQIIHQTGKNNFASLKITAEAALIMSPHRNKYKPFESLDALTLRRAAGVADLIITRAGSTLFEIAAWAKPAIIIPYALSSRDHQKANAYNYARSGAGIVIEEKNMTAHILTAEIDRIIGSEELKIKMQQAAKTFSAQQSASQIASQIVSIALEHTL